MPEKELVKPRSTQKAEIKNKEEKSQENASESSEIVVDAGNSDSIAILKDLPKFPTTISGQKGDSHQAHQIPQIKPMDPSFRKSQSVMGGSAVVSVINEGDGAQADTESLQDLKPPVKQLNTPTSTQIAETMIKLEQAKTSPFKLLEKEYDMLSGLEKHVLEIAKEVLKKKKYDATIEAERVENMSDLVEQLYSKCIAKLTHTKGFSKEDIFKAIQDLEQKKWIVTDHRRTKEEILEAPTLRSVLNFIHEHPGTHARDPLIETELGITRNPFIKHVMVLDAFGLIRVKKIGRTQNYFICTVPDIFDDFVVLFSNPLVPQIIWALLKDETVGLSEIARQLGVYHGAIQYHIKALAEMGIVIKGENSMRVNRELLRRYNSLYKHPPFGC